MVVAASRPFQLSVGHHAAEDLTVAAHDVDLVARDEVFVHLDFAHRGLGNLACGPDVLPRYLVGPGRYRFSWTLSPFRRWPADVAAVARAATSRSRG